VKEKLLTFHVNMGLFSYIVIDRKITEFLNAKEDQRAAFNKLKAERDAAKASIVAKAIERIMQAQVTSKSYIQYR